MYCIVLHCKPYVDTAHDLNKILRFSPATVILFVTYGLVVAGSVLSNEVVSVIFICLTTLGFGAICLYTSQTTQLRVAKMLTFVFAIMMCSVAIGVAEQVCNLSFLMFLNLAYALTKAKCQCLTTKFRSR